MIVLSSLVVVLFAAGRPVRLRCRRPGLDPACGICYLLLFALADAAAAARQCSSEEQVSSTSLRQRPVKEKKLFSKAAAAAAQEDEDRDRLDKEESFFICFVNIRRSSCHMVEEDVIFRRTAED